MKIVSFEKKNYNLNLLFLSNFAFFTKFCENLYIIFRYKFFYGVIVYKNLYLCKAFMREKVERVRVFHDSLLSCLKTLGLILLSYNIFRKILWLKTELRKKFDNSLLCLDTLGLILLVFKN